MYTYFVIFVVAVKLKDMTTEGSLDILDGNSLRTPDKQQIIAI